MSAFVQAGVGVLHAYLHLACKRHAHKSEIIGGGRLDGKRRYVLGRRRYSWADSGVLQLGGERSSGKQLEPGIKRERKGRKRRKKGLPPNSAEDQDPEKRQKILAGRKFMTTSGDLNKSCGWWEEGNRSYRGALGGLGPGTSSAKWGPEREDEDEVNSCSHCYVEKRGPQKARPRRAEVPVPVTPKDPSTGRT